jgi:ferredoxin like protein
MEKPVEGRSSRIEVDLNVDDLLGRLRYVIDHGRPHILIDPSGCADCVRRDCLKVCPVRAYRSEEGGIALRWERCIECGACLHVCDRGAIRWSYPRGGRGVSFRLG